MYFPSKQTKTSLLSQYGSCIVPKGTLLFREYRHSDIDHGMFFYLDPWLTDQDTCQLWEAKRDFEVIFLVREVTCFAWAISAVPHIYYELFPEEKNARLTDLCIKQHDTTRRRILFSSLYNEHSINGWFTSLEGNPKLEICLFDKENNSKLIQLKEVPISGNIHDFQNSLRSLKVFPCYEFYERTHNRLCKEYSESCSREDFYNQHLDFYNLLVESHPEKLYAAEFYWDLRLHLKV
jgi:hypothetical protein